MTDSLSLARWQFRIAWSLLDEVHLPRLSDAMCLWQPHPSSWTVHLAPDGRWLPDWADQDPVDPPPPSVGWLTWHLIWWWSDALAVLHGSSPAERSGVCWPGSAAATVASLRGLAIDWVSALDELSDVYRPVAFPWPEPRPVIYLVSWANLELMKNAAEIGEVANLFATR